MATLKISNWGKPSDRKWKLAADIALYMIPLYLPIIAALDPVSPKFSLWTVTLLSMTVVTIKGLTKFTAEENIDVPPTT